MIDFTPIARPIFARRIAALDREAARGIAEVQLGQLRRILAKAAKTRYGAGLKITPDMSYDQFRAQVPVVDYEDLRPWVMRMVGGEPDVLWPGVTRRFAQSSGTSGGKSKYIPLTSDSLRLNHYQGGFDVVAHYLDMCPGSRVFGGKAFILGGSFANEVAHLPRGVKVGDLSAHLIDKINPLVNSLFRVPDKKTALISDWSEKLPRLVEAAARQDITNISGVPSWFLKVLKSVIEYRGARTIHDVWPNLEVFFHGGIAFGPYRQQYAAITDPERIRFIETYNASEGFFAMQTSRSGSALEMLLDGGVFCEFLPIAQIDAEEKHPLAPWEVEPGRTYALVITSCNGLMRYIIGDTVRICSTDPLTITIAGRTHAFINAFGEEVMVYNTDRALEHACAEHRCTVRDYHVYPVFADTRSVAHHQWIVEWDTPPADEDAFMSTLDLALQDENSDYQAKRQSSIFLNPPGLTVVAAGTFDRYLASTGRLGGQRKVPRLSNSGAIAERILNTATKTDK